MTHFEISAQLNSDCPDSGIDSSAPAHAQSSSLSLVFLSKLCQARERKISEQTVQKPTRHMAPYKRVFAYLTQLWKYSTSGKE